MADIRYISTKEAAGIMGLSTRRVVGLCNAGKLEGALWERQLAEITDSIVFIDTGNAFIKTEEFTGKIMNLVKREQIVDCLMQ